MKMLRFLLLGLAAVVIAALGWRLTSPPPGPGGAKVPPRIAAAEPPVSAPSVPPAIIPPPVETAPAPVATTPPAAQVQPQQDAVTPPPAPKPPAEAPPAAPAAPAAMTSQDAQAKIVAVLQAAPDLARAFDAMKAQFPAVADRTLAEATEAYRASAITPSPDDLFAGAMRELRLSAGVLAARAGPDALGAIFEAKAKVLADLEQADPRICADYLYGGTSPEFADFEAAHRGLVAANALATIDAMADGRTRQKSWGEPSPEDFHWIEGALARRGLSPDEIADLLDGRSPATPPSDARLCDNARTYLDVLKTMPPDARNRVYGLTAELLARS